MSRRNILIGLIVFIVFGFYFYKSQIPRPLPTGEISQDIKISPSPIVTPAEITPK
jgi:hypothetical protein